MREANEVVQQTLVREFSEEALSLELKFDKENRVVVEKNVTERFKDFFNNGTLVSVSLVLSVSIEIKKNFKIHLK